MVAENLAVIFLSEKCLGLRFLDFDPGSFPIGDIVCVVFWFFFFVVVVVVVAVLSSCLLTHLRQICQDHRSGAVS